MTSNLKHWDRLAEPPASALRQIPGGRLRGLTDINPQWRLHVMTAEFGPCGEGWKYTIDRLWTEAGIEEVFAFAQVSVYIWFEDDAVWSDPIPGIGGSKLVAMEKGSPYNNDEAYKMAVTDALSVAFKALGVASKVYESLWDGSKFHDRPEHMVTDDLLNSLILKYSGVFSDELDGLDKPTKEARFNSWCRTQIGEHVDYRKPASWRRDWYDQCLNALNGPGESVPFEV